MVDEVKEGQEQTPAPKHEQGRVANVDEAIRQQQAKQYLNNDDDKAIEEEKRVAAEAAKKAEEEAKANGDEKPDEEEQTEWDGKDYVDTGIESADAVIALLKEAKIDPVLANGIFEKAMETQDINDVKWDVLAKHLSPAQLTLVRAGVKDTLESAVRTINETKQIAHELVGGADNWKKVTDWARAETGKNPAWAKQYAGYKQAVDQGGPVAELALKAVKEAYEAKHGTVKNDMVRGQKHVDPKQDQGAAMSRSEYYAERSKLEKAGKATEANIKALFARRQAGIKQGI